MYHFQKQTIMRSGIKIAVGLMMLASVIAGYAPEPDLLVEFTCVSNVLGGLLLIADGIRNFKGKTVPNRLYLNVCSGILFVFLVCLGSLSGMYHMNYSGAFFFLHAVNPVLIILCYIILYKDDTKRTFKRLAITLALILTYLLFDFIFGNCRGYFVYQFCRPEDLNLLIILIIALSVYLLFLLFGLLLLALNRLAHRK